MAGADMTWCRMCGGGGDVQNGDDFETCPICAGSGEHPVDLAYGAVGGGQPPVHYDADDAPPVVATRAWQCFCGTVVPAGALQAHLIDHARLDAAAAGHRFVWFDHDHGCCVACGAGVPRTPRGQSHDCGRGGSLIGRA